MYRFNSSRAKSTGSATGGDIRCGRVTTGSALLAVLSTALLLPAVASADATTWQIDEQKSLSLGAGLRTTFTAIEDGADSGEDYSKEFAVQSMRLYMNGQLLPYLGFTFNTEYNGGDGDGTISLLDALVRLEPSELFNVWAGRLLPPTDRSNLSGPYYLGAFTFPIAQAYPSAYVGRDDGVAVWGQVGGGMFKYQVGAFQGFDNEKDDLLYAGRLTFNFWDPEPGYYNSSTYFGAKDILAVGLTGQFQKNATEDTDGNNGDFTGFSIDVLMERAMPDGVVTLEGAYYDFDYDGILDPDFGYEGDGYFVLGSFLFPQEVGIGRFQPQVRYQRVNDDLAVDTTRIEGGLNYIMDGHNARASMVLGKDKVSGGGDSTNFFILGLQLQI